jgi:hypothetical protein
MNRITLTILALLLSSLTMADAPPRCNDREISGSGEEFLAGLSMPTEQYTITTESDGEVFYIQVKVPFIYEGLELQQINLKRVISGKPVLAAGLAYEVSGKSATSISILVWPSELNSVGFNVTYAKSISCSEGYSYLQRSNAYELVYKHNKKLQSDAKTRG